MKKKVNAAVLFVMIFIAVTVALIYTVSLYDSGPTQESTPASVTVTSATAAETTESTTEPYYYGISDMQTLVNCIAINNPKPFKSPKTANKRDLMNIAFWCVLQTSAVETFDFEGKQMVISGDKVSGMYSSVFENADEVELSSISTQNATFTYDKKSKSYLVPITGITPQYTGKIISQKEKGNKIILRVEYIPQSNWTQDSNGKIVPPKADKTITVTLIRKSDSSLSVCSVSEK